MKFREGDVVTVRGKIVATDHPSGRFFGKFKLLNNRGNLESQSVWVEDSDVVSIETPAFKVGDTISYLKTEYQVVGKIEGFIWVRKGDTDPFTINENNPRIERVEK